MLLLQWRTLVKQEGSRSERIVNSRRPCLVFFACDFENRQIINPRRMNFLLQSAILYLARRGTSEKSGGALGPCLWAFR